jgi:hypothetical protein
MPRSKNHNPLDKVSYFIVDSLIPTLIKLNIHPNIVTLIGFIPIYYIYIYIQIKNRFLVYLFAFINYTLDCLDGELARKSGKTSRLGGMLDSIHDITSFFSILYLVFNLYAIPIVFIFTILILYIFKMDPINHTAERYTYIFNFFHDNLNIFYYLTIECAIRFII